ncbi:MAG: glutamine--fructose-6-phosphate transaminase (isomerizing) [Nitrospirae bacterium]|nr:glutamine--fructose-6-phosphate transaminase (isomerizing) [Nitrospirota bacterium]
MCGIVGYIGNKDCQPILLDGLKRLEYRGYDSAGVAIVDAGQVVRVTKCRGKIAELEGRLRAEPLTGRVGVAHTRWATHGAPSDVNAHPHAACCNGSKSTVTVVHNGIIENYQDVRRELAGHRFVSETDTEVLAHLVESELNGARDLRKALTSAAKKIRGAFAVGVLADSQPGVIVAMRRGSPLVLGVGEGENFMASDIPALLPYTRNVIILEDGDLAVLHADWIDIFDVNGKNTRREKREITWTQAMAEKSGYPHYMLKEIFEQPTVIADTLSGRVDSKSGTLKLGELRKLPLKRIKRIVLTACGTSYHAALVGRAVMEKLTRTPVQADIASEGRYRPALFDSETLVVAISQSGETADTLACVEEARKAKSRILSICNVVDSSLARRSDAVLYTRAGPEIGVASTKTFTAQIVALILCALGLSEGNRSKKSVPSAAKKDLIRGLVDLPGQIRAVLDISEKIKETSRRYQMGEHFLYLGRGLLYPVAMEGALKLKEISYIHAEAYAAGEMKHGPIALIDERMPVVVFVGSDETTAKMLSNIEEVRSRGGRVIAVSAGLPEALKGKAEAYLPTPPVHPWLQPVLMAVVVQLLAYHIAVLRGTDVDQPRNLAKSVTVE